jgi:hypothetical protein
MPKKKEPESPEKQFERFRKTVQDMVDAGELNPTEVDERFERAMDRIASISPKQGEK